ncbi:MAG: ABC transporter ATP-binding protein [Gammaproteobacteria bacterium]|nr:ABC transporter ATP-binding protein [Gammaproteobacteria bacterium]
MSEANYQDRLDTQWQIGAGAVVELFSRSLAYLWPQRKLFTARVGLLIVIYGLGLLLPWFLKILVDHGVMQQPIQGAEQQLLYPVFIEPFLNFVGGMDPLAITLYTLIGLAVLFFFVGYSGNTLLEANLAEGADVATQSENKISAGTSAAHGIVGLLDLGVAIRLSQRITNHVRSELFGRLSHQSMTSLNLQRTGDALFRVLHDAPSVAAICHALTLNPLAMIVSVAANLWVLIAVYGAVAPELVWIGLSAVVLTLLATSPLARWARRISQASRASGSATTNEIEEGLKNVAAVQSLGNTELQRHRFATASKESFKQSLLLAWVVRAVEWIAENVHLVFATAGFWVIFSGIIRGELTLGDAPVVLRMYSLLYETSMQFGRIWIDQQDNAAAARRVFFSMDHHRESVGEHDAGLKSMHLENEFTLRLDHVSYRYPDGRQVLTDVSLEARSGEVLAIAGPSGSGKTTLAYLIPRFLVPEQGQVSINNVDLNELDLDALRKRVTYVFQEHQLLSDTVAANLRVANPDATEAEMTRVCELAGALDFVRDMPMGFDSYIGRGGATLSTGQKQRLSIARGLLRDAEILILDEPTSALDPESEQILLNSLVAPSKRLTIVITHRVDVILRANRVVFLEQGRIVEIGSPTDLSRRSDSRLRQIIEQSLREYE